MLDRNLRFEGFDTEDWTRLVELMRGRAGAGADAGLVVVHEARRVIKAVRTEGGATLRSGDPWPQPLDEVARRETVRWVLSVETGALEALIGEVARRVEQRHDMLDQLLVAWEAARRLATEGRLATWPTSVASIPIPKRPVLLRALGLICPPEQCVVVAAWEAGGLWTSLVMHRSSAGFDRIVGPDALRAEVETAGPEPEAMWAKLMLTVREQIGPVGLGIAAEHATWLQVATAHEAGAWARAVASGEVRIDPFARGVALPLAVDASRMALEVLRSALGRTGRQGNLGVAGSATDFAQLWQVVEGLWRLHRAGRR